MTRTLRCVALCLPVAIIAAAHAQSYPARPIRLVVSFAAGGGVDLVARLVGQKLSEAWGQQVVIDNRPGAGGNVSAELVAKSPPDGYTIYISSASIVVNASLYRALPYDPLKDFAPVTLLVSAHNVLVAHPSLPAKNIRELIALAKKAPGQINYASTGSGSSGHLAMELFRSMAGIQLTHVPYKVIGQATTDLLSGQVSLWFPTMPGVLAHIKAGRMNALGVSGSRRAPALPDVPTIAEAGVPGYEASTWYPVLAPAGTPQAVVDKLNAQLIAIVASARRARETAGAGHRSGRLDAGAARQPSQERTREVGKSRAPVGRQGRLMHPRGLLAAITVAALLAGDHAAAQSNYPSKPVRLIVGAAPGGSGDLLGRALAHKLTELWGQQIVIDNRPGAGTVIGTAIAAKSAPDGYTLFQANAAHTINPSLLRELPYDTLRDFTPITLSVELPNVLVLHPSVQARTVKELIALIQSRPGQFNYASSGIGNATHLAAELFRSATHTQMVHVPYKSGGFALTGVISAQVQLYFATLPAALPHINSGRLRALAVTTIRRSSAAPQLPTMNEAGVPGFEVTSWYGILAPAGTPPAIVAKLNRDIVATLQDPAVRSQIAAQGADPVGNKADEFAAFISRELVKWARLVKEANIRPEGSQ